MAKSFNKIDDILENSDKAELIEKLSKVLDVEGCKVVVITGVPNKETEGLDMEVWQTGHAYRYEEWGFIQEGSSIVENCSGDTDVQGDKG